MAARFLLDGLRAAKMTEVCIQLTLLQAADKNLLQHSLKLHEHHHGHT
jgi:hypothetical protein